jgi:hypothetical protein
VYPDAGARWVSPVLSGGIAHSPAIAPDGTLRAHGASIHSLEPDGGARWNATAPSGGNVMGIAVADDGRVIASRDNGAPFAVASDGGSAGSANGFASACGQPVLDADEWTYVACNGFVYAYDATLTQKWQYAYQGTFNGAPVLGANGVLFFTVDAYTTTPLTSAVYAIR